MNDGAQTGAASASPAVLVIRDSAVRLKSVRLCMSLFLKRGINTKTGTNNYGTT
jgi:hypothetical protein